MIKIPPGLIAAQETFEGDAGRAFLAELPHRAEALLRRWDLRVDGRSMHGMCALVLPVVRADGSRAALKIQRVDEETADEPIALRAWNGDGAVRLLDVDAPSGALLLERCEARTLAAVPDTRAAVLVIGGLLARLTAVPAVPELRRLTDIAAAMLAIAPEAIDRVRDDGDRSLLADSAAALGEVAEPAHETHGRQPEDRLLHWELHFDNVLASEREPWLAIDPKPLAGDPGFELFPALDNRFEPDKVVWRFDALTEILGLDRERARAWTLGRVLQNSLWELQAGRALVPDHLEIARRLLARTRR